MTALALRSRLEAGCADLAIALPEGGLDRLVDYLALLVKWNGAYNLTAVRQAEEMVSRHLLDSLAVLPFLIGQRLADVGTGAGLPGIPLAIASPQRRFDLIDSNGKKIRFVKHAIRSLQLDNARTQQLRVESCHPDVGYDAVLSRAFAALAEMCRGCGPLLAPDGRLLALKGQYPAAELAALPPGYTVEACHRLKIPGATADRHLVVIRRSGPG